MCPAGIGVMVIPWPLPFKLYQTIIRTFINKKVKYKADCPNIDGCRDKYPELPILASYSVRCLPEPSIIIIIKKIVQLLIY